MSFSDSLGMLLRRAYLTTHRAFNAHFEQRGATADQFVVLSVLVEGEGVNQQELSRRVASDPNTIASMLAVLESRGFIVRKTAEGDGRSRTVHLTVKGRNLQRRLTRSALEMHARLDSAVSQEHARGVLAGLDSIARMMPQTAAARPRTPSRSPLFQPSRKRERS